VSSGRDDGHHVSCDRRSRDSAKRPGIARTNPTRLVSPVGAGPRRRERRVRDKASRMSLTIEFHIIDAASSTKETVKKSGIADSCIGAPHPGDSQAPVSTIVHIPPHHRLRSGRYPG
jgi:hypothetical protein